MHGHRNIIRRFGLKSASSSAVGFFDWQTRMGVHLAFHSKPMNIFLHIVMPPFNALGLFIFLYPFMLPGVSVFSMPLSLALLSLLASFAVFIAVDILAAVLTIAPMLLLYYLCAPLYVALDQSMLWMMLIGVTVFMVALWVQVAIGHSVYEHGIGDEDENIAELFESKNPVYFILLPIYPTLDVLFRLGYRKRTAHYILTIAQELRPQVEARKQQQPASKGI